jgi:hypothetical protein
LKANNNDKIKDILNIILSQDWRARISEEVAISIVKVNISDAKLKAIYAPYFCSACTLLLRTQEEVTNHAFRFHPQYVKRGEHGPLTIEKLKNSAMRNIADSELGQTVLSLGTGHYENVSNQVLPLALQMTYLAHPDNPDQQAPFDFSRIRRFDDLAPEILAREEEQLQQQLQQEQL